MRSDSPAESILDLRPSRNPRSAGAARPTIKAVASGLPGRKRSIASTKRSVPFSGRMRPIVAIPKRPGWPVAAHAAARSGAGWNACVSTPWGITACTLETKPAAASLVATTASMREISQRGMAEWRRTAAEVKTIFTGRRRTSRTHRAADISEFRRTCQIVKGSPGGGVADIRAASARLTGEGQPGRGLPHRTMSCRCACCRATAAAVADTPVKRLLKFVTISSGMPDSAHRPRPRATGPRRALARIRPAHSAGTPRRRRTSPPSRPAAPDRRAWRAPRP